MIRDANRTDFDLETDCPANLSAEIAILGAILLDNADFVQASATLDAEDFSLDSHRRIFLRMAELMASDHQVDIVTLANAMRGKKVSHGQSEVESIGGVAYLASLTEGLPRRPRIAEYISIVKEKAKLRRIMGVCVDAIRKAEMQMTTAAAIVKEMGQGLKGIK
jgi:replicative DNA helicase